MVWDMTLPDPKFYCLKPSRTQNEKWLRIKAHPLPVTLMVSKESRNHAQLRLKRYTISTNPLGPFDAQPYGYFNPRTDVLHLPFWSNQRKLGRFPFEKFSFHLDVTQSGRVTTIIMPNLLVRLKYADKFPDIFMVMQDEMNGFKRHNSCNTWVPVGMPVIDRPWNNAFLQSLLDHRRFHEEGHPTATITAMPLACTCPGIADRMVAKVDMAIREHKRKTRKEEQKAQRAKAIKERRERAALTRSLARQEREETTKASGEKIRIRTRLASRFHAMSPSESSQAENLPWLEEHKQKRQINKFSGFKVIA
ncbi:uncharacterized protein FFUJ_11498 [Fusarium fujikuroi IMI 58289]|uniref:2EXR domain-containing protein n=1 Tax=Gibberella fujikuroi (strain CBS 195.34 / IMI 58289 / NRRL A-6831) TaxID=1279085 RepID=S0EN44_GIBF5|nr:uncharacterized protein FFUJ_11498 [Fusarium fujikuroi IMI 58289]CCT76062.1 uncharacterized protein FFUJ_11498 [Fusarium fujikuroi IMI 58289]SCO15945.1 uncharacterized protein FFC1_12676 [Fusarium fujikuroi]SCO21117.1 uncharacterized protein FFE2_14861 [Fusarium fujikuroi]SCO56921.1 uncharacterized protein FFMR_14077 [Fusarium fujikuroi]